MGTIDTLPAKPLTVKYIAPGRIEGAELTEWTCLQYKLFYCHECNNHISNLQWRPIYEERLYHIDWPTTGHIWKAKLDTMDQQEKEYDLHKTNSLKVSQRPKTRFDLGAREFTLTYSNKWFDDAEARIQMTKAIDKLCKYYKDEFIYFRAVGEVGASGLSHIHGAYKLQGGVKITDKNFKRAWPRWNPAKRTGPTGFEGGHHKTIKLESDFMGYIEKDIETAWLDISRPSPGDPV